MLLCSRLDWAKKEVTESIEQKQDIADALSVEFEGIIVDTLNSITGIASIELLWSKSCLDPNLKTEIV